MILGETCDIDMFSSAKKLVAFACIDPVIQQYGNSRIVPECAEQFHSSLRISVKSTVSIELIFGALGQNSFKTSINE